MEYEDADLSGAKRLARKEAQMENMQLLDIHTSLSATAWSQCIEERTAILNTDCRSSCNPKLIALIFFPHEQATEGETEYKRGFVAGLVAFCELIMFENFL